MEDTEKKKDIGKLDTGLLKRFEVEDGDAGLQGPPRAQNKALQEYEKLNIFQEPVRLVAADETQHISLNENAISDLMKIKHPVNVVSVVGKYRTGKSLLLNRLASRNKAFAVGSSHQAMTKGIWVFCRPHPTQESQILVLLDTEGLDDAMKDNTIEERWYFVLATLLSSTLVYNHKGTLDAGAIQKLEFLKNIKTTINVLELEQVNDSFFDVFFPVFVIAVRDNHLEITDEKMHPISSDQFLENVLALRSGERVSVREFNEPRILVRKYFKERKCFMFCPPRSPQKLDEGNKLSNIDFERNVESFLDYVYGCKPKSMASGKVLTGRMFGNLVGSFTKIIQEGETPCVQSAAKEMIAFENQDTLRDAQNVYKKEMQKLIGENMPSFETMVKLHEQCMEKATDHLRRNIIYDDIQLFLDTAKDSFIEILNKMKKSIAEDSENICRQTLNSLNDQRIGQKLKMKTYEHVDGYDDYIKDIDWIIQQYNETRGLGPKMQSVLQDYLDGKEKEKEAIYQNFLKAQGESRRRREEKSIESFKASSKQIEAKSRKKSGVSDELLKLILEDQQLQKQAMSDYFSTYMDLKTAEYERQRREGAESSAAVTKKENDRFKEVFLKSKAEESIRLKPRKCKIL